MHMSPTAPQERIQYLDVLRGIAILGMFAVNMTVDVQRPIPIHEMDLVFVDFMSVVLVDMFGNGKFIMIFSFLFGIGFYMQYERTKRLDASFAYSYIRRSAGLLLIGLTAMALTLPAWILLDYAVFGVLMLLLYKRSPKTILIAAIVLIVFAKLVDSNSIYQEHLDLEVLAADQGVPVVKVVVQAAPEDLAAEQENERIRSSGTFVEVSKSRLSHVWKAFSNWRYYPNNVGLLGYMLLGLYLAKRGVIRDREMRNSIAGKALPWLLGVGMVGALVFVLMQNFGVGAPGELAHKIILDRANWPAGAVGLGLAYAATITLLMQRQIWQRWLAPFAAVGRLALTNYLFTCFVYAIVFTPWGFGLYGSLMPFEGLVIVLLVYLMQVIASRWWIGHFRFGPCEWMWRSMTYGKLPPMRTKKTVT
jgi:uncharacterized protein